MPAFLYRYILGAALTFTRKGAPWWGAFRFLAIFEYANRENAVQKPGLHFANDGKAGRGIGGICGSVFAFGYHAERDLVYSEGQFGLQKRSSRR
jgi:hypothetical protein